MLLGEVPGAWHEETVTLSISIDKASSTIRSPVCAYRSKSIGTTLGKRQVPYPGRMSDGSIDKVLERWRELHPEFDVTPIALWGSIARLAQLADRWTTDNAARHGMQQGDASVLVALYRSGGSLRPRDLRRAMIVGSGTLTPRVDRLVARGYAERVPDQTDQRGTVVRLTDEGRRAVPPLVADLLAVEAEILDRLPRETVHRLVDDLAALLEVVPAVEVPSSG